MHNCIIAGQLTVINGEPNPAQQSSLNSNHSYCSDNPISTFSPFGTKESFKGLLYGLHGEPYQCIMKNA